MIQKRNIFEIFNSINVLWFNKGNLKVFLERWIAIYNDLERESLSELKSLLMDSFKEYRDFMKEDFDMERIENESVKMMFMYLRGETDFMLSREKYVEVPGELEYRIEDFSLAILQTGIGIESTK